MELQRPAVTATDRQSQRSVVAIDATAVTSPA
jgi:hypothetical protein